MSDTYWMVERSINGRAHWWMRPPINHEHWDSPHRWTTDSALAVHFPAKEAAELVVASDMCECFATEHMDIELARSVPLEIANQAINAAVDDALYMVRTDKAQALMEAEKAMAQIREATAKVVKERDEARAERDKAEADRDAIRELMNVYNLGGWTDALEPMKRALKAEAEAAALRVDAERYRWLRMNRLWLKANLPMIAAPELDTAIDQARGGND